MILLDATGSYKTLLPKGPDDPTSVVYTISAVEPPRSIGPFLKIPDGILQQKKLDRIFSNSVRRASIGDLVFTVKIASPVKARNSSRMLSFGQVLEFTAEDIIASLTSTSDSVEAKHNNDYINIEVAGLNESDNDIIASEAMVAQQSILDSIERYQKEMSTLGVKIGDIQARLNESNKILSGLTVINNINGSMADKIQTVNDRISNLTADLNNTMELYSSIPGLIEQKKSELITLSNLVK